jgi:UDP-2,4-diacetamido-2,4,6-trideoxy-beta-L-altropyranose hydrolase
MKRLQTVAIRVDASITIGTGHVVRCLTLAEMLRTRGVSCHFISREHPGHMINAIRQHGFQIIALPEGDSALLMTSAVDVPLPAHADWLGCDWRLDADQTLHAVQSIKPDLLVIDHYAIDSRWEEVLRPHVRRLMVIDDLADRKHLCDFLLDQNWFGDDISRRYEGLVSDYCVSMLGPGYALLKPEYLILRNLMQPRDGEVRRVLVFMGGSDSTNETSKAIEALSHPDLMHLLVDVVIGANHPDQLGIASKAEARHGTYLHIGLPSLAGPMMRADLMVGGGGATTWERMCLGLPAIVICMADNQVEINRALSRAGYIELLGCKDNVDVKRISEVVSAFIKSREVLITMSTRSHELVSGDGASKVCDVLLQSSDDKSSPSKSHPPSFTTEAIQIRYASLDDAEMLFEWRNDIRTRKYSRNQTPLSRSGHMSWLSKTLASERSKLLIAMCGANSIGCVRFDINYEEAEVSIYLDPAQHGRDWGFHVLSQAMEWMESMDPSVTLFIADVLAENLASTKLFQRCGYSLTRQRYEFRRVKE